MRLLWCIECRSETGCHAPGCVYALKSSACDYAKPDDPCCGEVSCYEVGYDGQMAHYCEHHYDAFDQEFGS